MHYFYAVDPEYYSDKSYEKLLNLYGLDEIVSVNSAAKLEEMINKYYSFSHENEEKKETVDCKNLSKTKSKRKKNFAVISPFYPDYFNENVIKANVFELVVLKNKHGLLTSVEHKNGVKVEDVIKNRLGTNITKPKLNLSNYGGADLLRNIIKNLPMKDLLGIKTRGFFLSGFPGSGKTFFAKCVAGELDRYLIELNLAKFMQLPNTLGLLEAFFDFFKQNTGDYIIWIDEIEKMLTTEESIQVLGFLLTKINDLHDNSKSNVFLIATANNPTSIASRNPELFRNGRFDWLISLLPPTEDNAKIIIDIYKSKFQEEFLMHLMGLIYGYIFAPISLKVFDNVEKNSAIAHSISVANQSLEAINSLSSDESICKYKDKKNLFVENRIKILDESYALRSIISSIKKVCFFDFSTKEFSHNSTLVEKRRDNLSISDRFPYVPAEIEFAVAELYTGFLFNSIDVDSNIKDVITKVIPLQVSMKNDIDKIKEATSSFLSV